MTSGIVLIPFLCLWSPSVWADTDCIRGRVCGWIFSPHQRLQEGMGMCPYAVSLMEFYWKQQLTPSKSGCLAPTLGPVLSASQRASNLASGVLQWSHMISPLGRPAVRLGMASEISSLFESDCTRIHLRQLSLRIHSWSIGRGGLMCILSGAKVSANIRSGRETQSRRRARYLVLPRKVAPELRWHPVLPLPSADSRGFKEDIQESLHPYVPSSKRVETTQSP